VLDLVQEFYSEERVMTILADPATGATEDFTINQVTPVGEVLNDLTLGEYGVVISSVPHRETLEDSQFEQAVALKELGVQIPDDVLIDASRLMNKKDTIKRMQGDQTSPEAQAQKQLQQRAQAAEVSKAEGEAAAKHADAQLKGAKTQETMVKAQVLANTPPEGPEQAPDNSHEVAKTAHEMDLAERQFQHDQQMDFMKVSQQRQEHNDEMTLRSQQVQQEAADRRMQAAANAAAAAQKPQAKQPTKGLR
jgi:hypothetical protein